MSIAVVGLARIHCLQEHFGDEPSAQLLAAPDATPSSNPDRCASGFASGTRYWWPRGHEYLPVGFGPNACGICVVGLADFPDVADLRQRLDELVQRPIALDGIAVAPDFGRKNHFLGIFKVVGRTRLEFPYVAILHCSAPELALADQASPRVKPRPEQVKTLSTPAGPIDYVAGGDVAAYLDVFQAGDLFAQRKRAAISAALFSNPEIISNRMHQGFAGPSELVLGSHFGDGHDGYVYLGGFEESSYLYRAADGGAQSSLDHDAAVRLLPHGAGATYEFADASQAEVDSDGRLRITIQVGTATLDLRHTGDLPYKYRPSADFADLVEAGYIEQEAELEPCYTLRS